MLCAHQSSALNWVFLIVASPVFATQIKYNCDVLSTGKKEEVQENGSFLHFVIDTINWKLDCVSYNSGVIMLVISNHPRATRSADLKLLT